MKKSAKATQSAVVSFFARSAPEPPSRPLPPDRSPASARADTETNDEKRKARYKADSPEVQTFYRVNRYPAK